MIEDKIMKTILKLKNKQFKSTQKVGNMNAYKTKAQTTVNNYQLSGIIELLTLPVRWGDPLVFLHFARLPVKT